MMRQIRVALYSAIVVLGLATAAGYYWKPQLERWIGNDVVAIGGPFELTGHDGVRYTRDDLLGHPHILYFGFTFCPDLCPTMLFELANVAAELDQEGKEPPQVVFVSVDPERDTVDALAEYVAAFDDRFIGLTGTPDEIDAITKTYKVYYRKVDLADGYTIDHTASALMFDARGDYVASIAHDVAHEEALRLVKDLLARS